MDKDIIKSEIQNGKTVLGIELGSTRIKAVLIDGTHAPIASGEYEWENKLEDGYWTYNLDEVWLGIQKSYAMLVKNVVQKYDVNLKTFAAIGFSAMMHGYLVFDKKGALLTPFRTWRNTNATKAGEILSDLFEFNVPIRWSISHLYQAILNKEAHVAKIAKLTTLSGYVHTMLTGQNVLGVGDASGMFPIDNNTCNYDAQMIRKFDKLVSPLGFEWKISEVLPKVLCAGQFAGTLTNDGAKLIDPTGELQAGIPLCPPEGDAGTGMVATYSVAKRTGNVSAGTSIFSMLVLEQKLAKVYPEIDIVTTPTGAPVAMVHCNNCTSDINAWVELLRQTLEAFGHNTDANTLYTTLYKKALEGDSDCGGLLAYNYVSGEPITGVNTGVPLFLRSATANFNLPNFMRTHLLSSLATLKIGMDILTEQENVSIEKLLGHGGLFKTKGVGQALMAAVTNTPVAVMQTAGEGGAWGIALLAAYISNKTQNECLDDYLNNKVFSEYKSEVCTPQIEDIQGFERFLENYKKGLVVEKVAEECFAT